MCCNTFLTSWRYIFLLMYMLYAASLYTLGSMNAIEFARFFIFSDSTLVCRRSNGKAAIMFKISGNIHSNKRKGKMFCSTVYWSIGWNATNAHKWSYGTSLLVLTNLDHTRTHTRNVVSDSQFVVQYYQALFHDGECFLHVVSLLNGNLDEANGEQLVLNVLQTLTCLLANNDSSKVFLIYYFLCLIYIFNLIICSCILFLKSPLSEDKNGLKLCNILLTQPVCFLVGFHFTKTIFP